MHVKTDLGLYQATHKDAVSLNKLAKRVAAKTNNLVQVHIQREEELAKQYSEKLSCDVEHENEEYEDYEDER